MTLPLDKFTLASTFLDHDADETLHGEPRLAVQSCFSMGSKNLAGGVNIAAWTSYTVRK